MTRASEGNNLQVLELYLKAGFSKLSDVKNFEGNTPLHIVKSNDHRVHF